MDPAIYSETGSLAGHKPEMTGENNRINSSRVDSGIYGDMDRVIYSETGSLAGHKPGMTGENSRINSSRVDSGMY